MVLSTWLEDELKKRRQRQIKVAVEKAVGKAAEKCRTEERQRWVDWNQRREAAAAAGEEFNEPPPALTTLTTKTPSETNKGANHRH